MVAADGTAVRRKPVVGDLHWDGAVWRRWSGRRWTQAAYSLDPDRLEEPARLDTATPVGEDRRRRALALAVEDQVVSNGATVVLDGPHGVVLGYPRAVSHVLHALMTLVTAGVWIVVWLALALGRGQRRVRLEADDWGNVWARPVADS